MEWREATAQVNIRTVQSTFGINGAAASQIISVGFFGSLNDFRTQIKVATDLKINGFMERQNNQKEQLVAASNYYEQRDGNLHKGSTRPLQQ
jgi:hypothetical protein